MKHYSAPGQNPKEDIYDIAAEWHNRLEAEPVSPRIRAEFDAWLSAEQAHRRAFETVDQMWSQMNQARLEPRIMELRRKALSAPPRRSSNRPRIAAAVAVLGLIAGAMWLMAPELPEMNAHKPSVADQRIEGGSLRTAVGERSDLRLSDGSLVVLNTNSHVDIRFTPTERRVRLLNGQAWFEVKKTRDRPFIVEAGNQRVTALGTAFDVRFDEHKDTVQVTLAEGKVSVEPIQSPLAAFLIPNTESAELTPGESIIASPHAPIERRRADVAKVGSWRSGQLVFDNDTLEAAIAEVNRYSPTQIELGDQALSSYRVSGVFRAGNTESFVETVTGHYPIRVVERQGGDITLLARSP